VNKAQVNILRNNGFVFEGLPNLHPQPRAKFYSRDRNNGRIVEHNLPADPYSLQHYIKKGFVLDPSLLPPFEGEVKPQAVEKSQEGFTCEVCGKEFSQQIALAGHKRTHKKIIPKEE